MRTSSSRVRPAARGVRRCVPRIAAFVAALLCAIQLVTIVGAQNDRRVLAIGDIHGAYDEVVRLLTKAGVIDANQQWTAGNATLVQTGDFTDRGRDVRKVMDLLMVLGDRAKSGGGEVVQLLGNHEVLNILGDLRDVTPEIASSFADSESEARREKAWKDFEALAAARRKVRDPLPKVLQVSRQAWLTAHPPGWLEYREALGPRGKYGRWLRTKKIAAVVSGTLFMHSGISPEKPATVDEVNSRAEREMERYEAYLQKMSQAKLALPFFTLQEVLDISNTEIVALSKVLDEAKASGAAPDLRAFNVELMREAIEIVNMGDWSLIAADGPLWFRGFAEWPESDESASKVKTLADKLGVQRIAIGHTPTKDGRIASRFGGRVILMDTGMLTSVYKGRPSMLEIRGNEVAAVYEDGPVKLAATR